MVIGIGGYCATSDSGARVGVLPIAIGPLWIEVKGRFTLSCWVVWFLERLEKLSWGSDGADLPLVLGMGCGNWPDIEIQIGFDSSTEEREILTLLGRSQIR